MATRIRVRKLANPRRKKRRNKRKLSRKQIRFFGTKAQKAGLKRRNKRRNPVRKRKNYVARRVNKKTRRRTKRRSNPALVVTLGAMNPRRKKRRNKPVAAKRRNRKPRRVAYNPPRRRRNRKRNPQKRRRARRNATRVIVVSPRRANRKRRNSRRNPARRMNRRTRRTRRNPPELFGAPLFGRDAMELVGGGLVGVAAAKFIPTLLPASLTGSITSSSIGKLVITGIAAVVGGWAGAKISPKFGQGVLFGGMMQAASVGLNAFFPSVYSYLNPSLGDLMNGGFSVPQNPLRLPPPPPAAMPVGSQARVQLNGLSRAFGAAL